MFPSVVDFQKLGKDQFDAASRFASVYTKNVQQLAAESADYSKKSLEQGAAALEKLLGAKTLDKAIEVQSEYARQAYEAYVAQATKVGEVFAALGKDAMKPLETAFAKAQGK